MLRPANPLNATCLMVGVLGLILHQHSQAQSATQAPAKPAAESFEVVLAEGALKFTAPGEWKQVRPRNRIIEAEIAVPAEEEGGVDGRLTVMAAGGSVRANVDRWRTQFKPGSSGGDAKVEEDEVDGMKLTWFDASGTFMESTRGPFGPKVERPDYRMLAAILQTGGSGNYFFKLTGPADLIEEHAERFRAMVSSTERSQP
ncbi:MAG: hypothetical protein AAGJ46_09130 [Planctomycetota bacterium]